MQALDLVLAHGSVAQAGAADPSAGADDALHEVKAFHLQAVDEHLCLLGGHAAGQVEEHRALAHAGAGGDQDKLSATQPAGHGVKVAVAGVDAARLALFQNGALHLNHDAMNHLAGSGGGVALAAHVHAQDALAGAGQGFLNVNGRIFGGRHHAAGGVKNAAAGHVAAQDVDVVVEVAAATMAIHLGQDTRTADPLKFPKFTQTLGHGEQVGRSSAGADGDDSRQDALVGWEEKVFGGQFIPLVDDVGVQHERAKDVALGGGVVRDGRKFFHGAEGGPPASMTSATTTKATTNKMKYTKVDITTVDVCIVMCAVCLQVFLRNF